MMGSMKMHRGYWTALSAFWVATGCGSQPDAASEVARASTFTFDVYPAAFDEVPVTEGSGGVLSYSDGCLYVRDYEGGATGIVMPDTFRFDGFQLTDGRTTFRIGDHASFSGGVIAAESVPGTRCKTRHMLIAQNTFAPPPPQAAPK
jgi:hypothetical protein